MVDRAEKYEDEMFGLQDILFDEETNRVFKYGLDRLLLTQLHDMREEIEPVEITKAYWPAVEKIAFQMPGDKATWFVGGLNTFVQSYDWKV